MCLCVYYEYVVCIVCVLIVCVCIVGVLCVSYMNVCVYSDLCDVDKMDLHVYLCVSYVYGVCIMYPVCVMATYAAQRERLWGADFKDAS